ncbi:polymorphic toxin type 15 domain-containing protein [Providencia hangzhouensis]|uniref:polymorphic toxin type 15 domain-containing protein n=1 Tax=Providencia hangzhouensis TaxID=3031799 RepID=UPI0034DDB180
MEDPIDLDTITVVGRPYERKVFPPIDEVSPNVNSWYVFTSNYENDQGLIVNEIGVDLFDKEGNVIFEGDYTNAEYVDLRETHPDLGLPPLNSVGNSHVEGKVQPKDGNTIGMIQNQPPKKNISASDANPIIKPETDEESQFWTEALDNVQLGVDIIGLIPGVNIIADGANALIYTARGDYTNAALSAAAMVPFAGWGAKGAKFFFKAEKAVIKTEKAVVKAEQQAVKKGAKVKPTRLPKKKLKCFFPYNNKAFKKMSPAEQKKYLNEYNRQLKRQEEAINNMTADEFMLARKAYKEAGRNKTAQKLQEDFRKEQQKIIENSIQKSLQKNGITDRNYIKTRAKEKSEEIMKNMAALHEPDMVAGGWHDPKPSGLGNTKVNSAIGGSWPSKVKSVDDATGKTLKESRITSMEKSANEAIKNGQGNAKMNMELEVCRGKGK